MQVSLRPSKASLKLSSAHHFKTSDVVYGNSETVGAERTIKLDSKHEEPKEVTKSLLPRTRDDSSDEEEASVPPAKSNEGRSVPLFIVHDTYKLLYSTQHGANTALNGGHNDSVVIIFTRLHVDDCTFSPFNIYTDLLRAMQLHFNYTGF